MAVQSDGGDSSDESSSDDETSDEDAEPASEKILTQSEHLVKMGLGNTLPVPRTTVVMWRPGCRECERKQARGWEGLQERWGRWCAR